jgi:hypothetical protein
MQNATPQISMFCNDSKAMEGFRDGVNIAREFTAGEPIGTDGTMKM